MAKGRELGWTVVACPVCRGVERGATLSEVRDGYVEHNIKALHFAASRRAEVAGA